MKLPTLAYRHQRWGTHAGPRGSSRPNPIAARTAIHFASCIRPLGILTSGMLAIACAQGSTGQDGSGGGTNGSSVAGTDASSGSMAASSSSSGSSGGMGGAGGMSTVSSSAAGNGGATAASSSSTGGPSPCDPAPGDTACHTCVKTNCCPEWTACQPDTICSCWVGCFLAGGTSTMCTQMCGAVNPLTTNLNMCQMNAVCPCP